MMNHDEQGLIRVSDPIAHIRNNPKMYLGVAVPCASTLVSALVEIIIKEGSDAVSVNRRGDWWLVAASMDWLTLANLSVEDAFSTLLPAPILGGLSVRPEILMAAFSLNVVTAGRDGLKHVCGSIGFPVPSEVSDWHSNGRIVAFRM
jgi:hypothetical protein